MEEGLRIVKVPATLTMPTVDRRALSKPGMTRLREPQRNAFADRWENAWSRLPTALPTNARPFPSANKSGRLAGFWPATGRLFLMTKPEVSFGLKATAPPALLPYHPTAGWAFPSSGVVSVVHFGLRGNSFLVVVAMASAVNWLDSRAFFDQANSAQFEHVLSRYKEALQHKCETKRKPAELQKLDTWFQEELPRILETRKPDIFFTHDELVQAIKWKLARGKFRPKLKELVQMNTPRVVMVETKKAWRQLTKKNVKSAITALSNLKGVAVLSVMAPEKVPFMADECLLAINKGEALDYSMNEFMQYLDNVEKLCERLNAEKPDFWTPHKVELALWSHYILSEMNPDSLDSVGTLTSGNALLTTEVTESTHDDKEPKKVSEDEDSRGSHEEHIVSSGDDELSRDSAGKMDSPRVTECHPESCDASNDSGVKMMQDVAAADSCDSAPSFDEPQAKKIRLEPTPATSDEKVE
ncbi:unnamed protein product [Notodromas monacha]|uniref:Uncharacterized protein n=1 Tax=Notodromas monacha TaxID=399045 RepID=A0A7R9G9T9_9CRUS|nr:unnamed protein product [Notodromas monacha]CAG0914603.1 unnamed protein product [Notodromas monacha]